jgi:molecular chaperone GrpE
MKGEEKDLKKKAEEYLAGWKRERADFLNFKKAESERIENYIKIAKDELILDFLPILDNIYLAEKELPQDNDWAKGFLGIKALVLDFLKKQGVEEIDCLNKEFDPLLHEAVEEVKDKKISGVIVEVVQRGYTLNNKVIRPARVKVSK